MTDSKTIGSKRKELAVFGFKSEGKISGMELKRLIRSTLEIPPLGDIFHAEVFDSSLDYRRLIRKNVVIVLIDRECDKAVFELDGNIIYSNLDPYFLAHELGHALGLDHPAACNNGCSPNEGLMYYLKRQQNPCLHTGTIMSGCGVWFAKKGDGFSQEEQDRLRGWYLK